MEIYLNENKAKDNNIDIESCYKKIDNYYFGDGPDSPEYRQDALESYYRLKEIHDDYVRNQKSS